MSIIGRLVIVMLISSTSFAQTVPNYYPLEVGNYWEYETNYFSPHNQNDTTYYSYKEVVGDTTLDGTRYFKVVYNHFYHFMDGLKFQRVDTSNGYVYEYRQNGDILVMPWIFEDSLEYWGIQDTIDLFGNRFSQIQYEQANYGVGDSWWYADHIGETQIVIDESNIVTSYRESRLTYAKVGNMEYGQRVLAVPQNQTTPKSITITANYPNPFNPLTTLIYSVAEQQQIELIIYNMMGQVLQSQSLGMKPAGTYQQPVLFGDLPSGLYLVRLKGKQSIATQMVTLLK